MTTYSYTITIDDSEMITLRAALTLYRDYCEGKNEVPYIAHRMSLEKINGKLYSNSEMTSTSSFCLQGSLVEGTRN